MWQQRVVQGKGDLVVLKYLLDSNIISEPSKPEPNRNVIQLLKENSDFSAISTVSYFEMMHGILIMPDGKRKKRLMSYLNEAVVPFYPFLAYDFDAALVNAKILAQLESVGRPIPFGDSQIASIALSKGLILVTRNVKDFISICDCFPLRIENWFDGAF